MTILFTILVLVYFEKLCLLILFLIENVIYITLVVLQCMAFGRLSLGSTEEKNAPSFWPAIVARVTIFQIKLPDNVS